MTATEVEFETTIVDAAKTLGYLVHVGRKARTKDGWKTPIKGHKGWVDVVIVGYGRAWFIELKRKPNKPASEQIAWNEALQNAGLDARIMFVPEELDDLLKELTGWRERAVLRQTRLGRVPSRAIEGGLRPERAQTPTLGAI